MKIKYLWTVLLGAVMVALLAAGMMLVSQFRQPLAPALDVSVAQAKEAAGEAAVQPLAQPALQATETPKRFCGSTGSLTILVVGSDAQPNVPPRGADLVRFLKVDFDAQTVTQFTLPRDLWLETEALKKIGVSETTLGQTYDYMYTATKPDDKDKNDQHKVVTATNAVAQVVYDTFGLAPDHYVAIKLSSLSEMIDTIGGVTVDVQETLVTRYDPPITFQPGVQTLNGAATSSYVRFMDETHSDWDRMERQDQVLDSLKEQIKDPALLTSVPDLFKQFSKAIVTDLSPEQIADLTCVLDQVPPAQMKQDAVHAEMVSAGPQGSMLPDVDAIVALLKSLGMVE